MESEETFTYTAKEERFCFEYCLCLNATKAAIKAGYSKKTARVIGSQNLLKLNIKTKIQQMKDNLAETSGISALRIIYEHQKIAFSDGSKLRNGWMELKEFEELTDEEKACIQEVQTKVTTKRIGELEIDETFVKIKLYSKQDSLKELANLLGFNAPTKNELDLNFDKMSETNLDSIINRLITKKDE